ncbi:MAG: hypothetical protein HC936_03235 [Leptolyngbyaceae cyanobacterium SU_3_3]|nr:hypothetical protein [Leptolyngbyaceae cyanobacterium SU_3_3]
MEENEAGCVISREQNEQSEQEGTPALMLNVPERPLSSTHPLIDRP